MKEKHRRPRVSAALVFTCLCLWFAPEAFAQWVQKATLNTPRARFAWAVSGGRYYALFGNNGNVLLNSVEVYDPLANTWTQSVPDPLQGGVQDVSAATWNGKIYLFGGNYGTLLDVQPYFRSYDTAAGTLSNETPRNPAVASPNALAYTETAPASDLGPLKIFGGVLASGFLTNQASAYDPGARVWGSLATIPSSLLPASPGAGLYTPDNLVFFFGGDFGQGSSTLVYAYNYFTKTFVTQNMGKLMVSRRFPVFGAIPYAKGRFYLAGGNESMTGYNSDAVEVYDPVLRIAWELADKLPQGLSGLGTFCLAGPEGAYTLYAAGGLTDDQTRSNKLYALCVDNGRGQLPSQLPAADTDLNNNQVPDINEPDVIKDATAVTGDNIFGLDISGDPDILSIVSIQAIPADFAGSPPRIFPFGAMAFSLAVTPGATVYVNVFFDQDVPANAIWYKYNVQNGWQSYAQDAQTVSARQVILRLTDGGTGDADGEVNGIIVDPGGPGTPLPPTPPEPEPKIVVPQGNGCFVESLYN
ncbi:MAG: choice-of-anchor U domain-containing protein [Thermodesulfobacteriota bacterium]